METQAHIYTHLLAMGIFECSGGAKGYQGVSIDTPKFMNHLDIWRPQNFDLHNKICIIVNKYICSSTSIVKLLCNDASDDVNSDCIIS